jgi:AbrB family looped-hinge helix DNA binding protein
MWEKLYFLERRGFMAQQYPKGKFISIVKVGDKGQIVIPKGARELFGIQPGDQLLLMADKKRGIALIDENSISVPERLWETAREADNDDPEG